MSGKWKYTRNESMMAKQLEVRNREEVGEWGNFCNSLLITGVAYLNATFCYIKKTKTKAKILELRQD